MIAERSGWQIVSAPTAMVAIPLHELRYVQANYRETSGPYRKVAAGLTIGFGALVVLGLATTLVLDPIHDGYR